MIITMTRLLWASYGGVTRASLTVVLLMIFLEGSSYSATQGVGVGESEPESPHGQAQNSNRPGQATLSVTVFSEDGTPVESAQIILTSTKGRRTFRRETDYSGKFKFTALSPGTYQLRVQKEGFYVASLARVDVSETQNVTITLNHLREVAESVKVVYTPPVIDPSQTSSSSSLNSRQIIDLPYVVPRDLRYALPLLPGVLQDSTGQIHIDGSSTSQILDEIDEFDVTDPVTGEFNERIAPEALRSINVEDSRYPVEYGRASGGILMLESGMGDDHYRFAGVNFLPTLDDQDGIHISSWTPRVTFSGPVDKGKAWFMDGFDGEYDLSIVNGLPRGDNEDSLWRFSNIAKAQVNLTPTNIFTGSFLVNYLNSPRYGLSLTTPLQSTVNTGGTTYLLSAKDQIFFHSQTYVELGLAATKLREYSLPWGDQTYVMQPNSVSGSYFETSNETAGRTEEFANLYLPAKNWLGQQSFELGSDDEEISYDQTYTRNPFLIEEPSGQLLQRATFTGNEAFFVHDTELSSYAQDRWAVAPRLLIEPGVRLDWDTMVHNALFQPRLAATFVPHEGGETKLVAGIGLYNDATNLQLITQPLGGGRLDTFYNPTTQLPVGPPVETSFQLQPHLQEPRVWDWSAGVEQKLPESIYFRGEYLQKREQDGWAYFNLGPSSPGEISGRYELRDAEEDRYDAIETIFRRAFKRGNLMMVSYVRSMARSNAVLDFDLESPIFAQQAGGPLPWDAPNRLLSWGLVPLVKGFDLAYTLDWRTGFPFSAFNQNQQLVGAPDSYRMPAYFSVDAALERRISLFGFKWDVRAGFDDLTGRHNPYAVNDNIDSPQFLTYSSTQSRTLQAQIRLLGRK
jgi:Carboxypeptidase regulatory-like domain